MRKIFTLLVLLAILPLGLRGQDGVSVWDGSTASSFAGGDGEVNSPYEISTAAELAYLAQQVNGGETYSGKYFILTNDIVLNEKVLDENGDLVDDVSGLKEWTPIGGEKYFRGTFDGDNKKIKGLYINSKNDNVGLFGYVSSGDVKNIILDKGYVSGNECVGGVVGCYSGDDISYCENNCTVNGSGSVGGIVGYTTDGITQYCQNNGIINNSSLKISPA